MSRLAAVVARLVNPIILGGTHGYELELIPPLDIRVVFVVCVV